jgi:hypothetical protein
LFFLFPLLGALFNTACQGFIIILMSVHDYLCSKASSRLQFNWPATSRL